MKGIILAGGSGTRLYPVTRGVSKQLLPIYDKPMIYYPLSVLMLAGIRDVTLISTPQDIGRFETILGDGSQWGINLEYTVQPKPEGIAQALLLTEKKIADEPCALILGDNIFYGHDLQTIIQNSVRDLRGATVFSYHVSDPSQYGVVESDGEGTVISIEEKPSYPKSNYAVTGFYLYDGDAVQRAKQIVPSARGEYEITDLNNMYLADGLLKVEPLGRGHAWLDTGTHDNLLEASLYVAALERRQGLKIACLEEIALDLGYIDRESVSKIAVGYGKSSYAEYLMRIVNHD